TPPSRTPSAKPPTEGSAKPAERSAKSAAGPTPMFDTTVVVRRRGEAIWLVDIAFKFAGKPVEHVAWDGRARWKRYDFHRPGKREWVDMDPERGIELDVDWLKNAERVEPDRRAAVRLTSRWLLVVQQMLTSIGM